MENKNFPAYCVRDYMRNFRFFLKAGIISMFAAFWPLFAGMIILDHWKAVEEWHPELFLFLVDNLPFISYILLSAGIAAFVAFGFVAFLLNRVSHDSEALRDSEVIDVVFEEYSRSNRIIQIWLEGIFPDLRDIL